MSYEKVGNVQVAQGDLAGALKSCQASLAIRDRLAKADPDNASWQRDLSVSYAKLGYVFSKAGQSGKARKAFVAGRATLTALIARHPDWTQVKQDAYRFDQDFGSAREEINRRMRKPGSRTYSKGTLPVMAPRFSPRSSSTQPQPRAR